MVKRKYHRSFELIELIPNRSMNSEMSMFHLFWLGMMFSLAALAFLLLGAWPIAIMFIIVWAVIAVILRRVNESLKRVETITVSDDAINLEGATGVNLKARRDSLKVYLGIPLISWAPLQFEFVDIDHPPCQFATALNREDGEELLRLLKELGVRVRPIDHSDALVKSF